VTASRKIAAAALAAASICAAAPPAPAAQNEVQRFFRQRLLADQRTSDGIKALLRSGGGVVDRVPLFRDLTGDDRPDAVVRVHSSGAAGVVAVYVFSTDTGRKEAELMPVFRAQSLQRASTRVWRGVLSYRWADYADGDELCCPSRVVEATLRWDARRHRLRIDERHEVPPAPPES
jgi:hypothetical protein